MRTPTKLDCPFCTASGNPDQHVIFETDHCRYLRKAQSQLTGAGLIVPRAHRETVFELNENEWRETHELLTRAKRHLDETLKPDGFTVGWNCGEIGGQHVAHAHLHVIPRFADRADAGNSIRDGIFSAI